MVSKFGSWSASSTAVGLRGGRASWQRGEVGENCSAHGGWEAQGTREGGAGDPDVTPEGIPPVTCFLHWWTWGGGVDPACLSLLVWSGHGGVPASCEPHLPVEGLVRPLQDREEAQGRPLMRVWVTLGLSLASLPLS